MLLPGDRDLVPAGHSAKRAARDDNVKVDGLDWWMGETATKLQGHLETYFHFLADKFPRPARTVEVLLKFQQKINKTSTLEG